MPFRRSTLGRAAYAAGSSEVAAYMSGVPIARAKFAAYTLSGLLASIGGLYLTFITYSGEASLANGGTYTLSSIAAVVIGGVSLFGGSGSAIGAIFGALAYTHDRLTCSSSSTSSRCGSRSSRASCFCSPSRSGRRACSRVRNRLDLFG